MKQSFWSTFSDQLSITYGFVLTCIRTFPEVCFSDKLCHVFQAYMLKYLLENDIRMRTVDDAKEMRKEALSKALARILFKVRGRSKKPKERVYVVLDHNGGDYGNVLRLETEKETVEEILSNYDRIVAGGALTFLYSVSSL